MSNDAKRDDEKVTEGETPQAAPRKTLRFDAERIRVLRVRSSVQTGLKVVVCPLTCVTCCRTY
jgi:hypothetical protein